MARSVCSGVRSLLTSRPSRLTSLNSSVYRPVLIAGPFTGRYCDGLSSVNGVIVANHGTPSGEKLGGGPGRKDSVGRHSPGFVPPLSIGGGMGKLPSVDRLAMTAAAACAPMATPGLVTGSMPLPVR